MQSQEKGEGMATKMSPKCTMNDPGYNLRKQTKVGAMREGA